MMRLTIAACLSALALSMQARAAPPTREIKSPTAAGARNAHVQRAERARNGRRWGEAVAAYQEALAEARRSGAPDTEIAALHVEIGSAALHAGQFTVAGEHFLLALDMEDALTPAQRRLAEAGGAEAWKHTGILTIAASPPDAEISVDGREIGSGQWAYTVFVEPGEHFIRATLPGYEGAAQSTTVDKGKAAVVTLELSRRAPAPPPASPPALPPVAAGAPARSERAAPALLRGLETMSFGLSLTPLLGFGVTPGTSVGATLDGTYRRDSLSFNVELRLLGSQVVERDDGIRTLRGGGNVSACGHLGVGFLCGLAGWSMIDVLEGRFARVVETHEPASGLLGLRSGMEWRFNDRLALRGFGELSLTMGRPSVWIDHAQYWTAPPVAGIVGVGFVVPVVDRPAAREGRSARSEVAAGGR